MQMKKTLFVAFVALLVCSSFMLKLDPSTGADTFVENGTERTLDAIFTTDAGAHPIWGVPPGGVANSRVVLLSVNNPVSIQLNFSSPLPHAATAYIYNKGVNNLVATIHIPIWSTSAGTTLEPPIGNDAIFVRIYPD